LIQAIDFFMDSGNDDIERGYRDRVVTLLLDVMPADHARLAESMRAIEQILHTAWLASA
jgi:hypothetical protein